VTLTFTEEHRALRWSVRSFLAAVSPESAANIAVHGGIGFTWEHPAHLFYRRAKSAQLQFGSPAHHREALLQLPGAVSAIHPTSSDDNRRKPW